MKIVIIGGTGHVGTYLIPRLVKDGHEVIVISRQQRKPYQENEAWNSVKQISVDREKEEGKGNFGMLIADLNADVVIDMICFTPESAQHLVDALHGKITHFLHCGTIWVHGHSLIVPTIETQSRAPFGEYGINKAAIEKYLMDQHKKHGFPVTILHPGHIVGPGWVPVNPAGNFNLDVYRKIAIGDEVILPNIGMETLHHVHADDVAQSFQCAMNNFENAVGEHFHVVSSQAITLRGYAEALAAWFGQKVNVKFLPWKEWEEKNSDEDAKLTWDHIAHSPNCNIEKAKQLLNYRPGYSSLDAVKESLAWLKDKGEL